MNTQTTAADAVNPADAAAPVSADTAVPTSEAATAQPTGEGQGDGESPAAGAATATDVPDAYTFNLPEGLVLPDDRAAKTTELFKELELSQDKAQKLVDFFVALRGEGEGEIAAQVEARVADAIAAKDAERQQRIEQWGNEARERFGSEYEHVASDARKGVAAMNTPALLEAFESEGWGNHPELVRVFARLGQLLGDSTPRGLSGEPIAPRQASLETRMYPGMARK